MKRLTIGIAAHVDAGKTTLTEALLYRAGALRAAGRVDHGDALLDDRPVERARGITVFAKTAVLPLPDAELTLLDTPGHVDFSAEAERALRVMDAAVLVVSATDGVQGHTRTLWRLLARYGVPVFLFVNKMDLPGKGREALLAELRERFGAGVTDFAAEQAAGTLHEALALCDETLMERFLARETLTDDEIAAAVGRRTVFPCAFGAALRGEGADELLALLRRYCPEPVRAPAFGARVFKIASDPAGSRLTFLKVTGGALAVRDAVTGKENGEAWSEKVTGIRQYSGARFTALECAPAGTVCAVTGLTRTRAGQGLGAEPDASAPLLEPVLGCRVELPAGADVHAALVKLRAVEQEDPLLWVVWDERLQEIRVQLMGEVQREVLQSELRARFGLEVGFGPAGILYKETIAAPVLGIGHFEPLRHYAEVHLLLEPGERGSGLRFASRCREDELDRVWQKQILAILAGRSWPGVLTGAPVTDMKITLAAGRAHLKHTEGGDFREAVGRALRQGLRSAQCLLLEPEWSFRLELPQDAVGRAMADLERMGAQYGAPQQDGERAVLAGTAAAARMGDYAAQVARYTKGLGRLSLELAGYAPCADAAAVIAASGYDPDADTENPADSVFCAHGAGYSVRWDEVPAHAHADSGLGPDGGVQAAEPPAVTPRRTAAYRGTLAEDRELLRIFERTYGPVRRDSRSALAAERAEALLPPLPEQTPAGPEYLLVDGYNIIFAWDDLRELASEDLDAARGRLIDILCNYAGYCRCEVILVFDAYRVKGNPGEVEKHHNISVVYTKEAETADMYIEKVTHELGREHRVRVATSDGMEQMIILGHGARRVPATVFRGEIDLVEEAIREILAASQA